MMNPITDEQLSAYLDGAGDREICEIIDRALENDEALRARVEHLQRSDRALRGAIDAQLGAVPERLEQIAADKVAVAQFGVRPRPRWLPQYAAIAASILIAFGAGAVIGRLPGANSPPAVLAFGPAGLTAGSDLADAISTAYSGVPAETPAGGVSIELSFRSAKGEFCRRFKFDRGPVSATGVACRKNGLWLIEGWTLSPTQTKRPAFAAAAGPSDAAIEAVIDRLGVEKSLNRNDEAAAIKSGWENGRP